MKKHLFAFLSIRAIYGESAEKRQAAKSPARAYEKSRKSLFYNELRD